MKGKSNTEPTPVNISDYEEMREYQKKKKKSVIGFRDQVDGIFVLLQDAAELLGVKNTNTLTSAISKKTKSFLFPANRTFRKGKSRQTFISYEWLHQQSRQKETNTTGSVRCVAPIEREKLVEYHDISLTTVDMNTIIDALKDKNPELSKFVNNQLRVSTRLQHQARMLLPMKRKHEESPLNGNGTPTSATITGFGTPPLVVGEADSTVQLLTPRRRPPVKKIKSA